MQNTPRIKPRHLRRGDTIGVIAPASPGDREPAAAGVQWLEKQGFRVRTGLSVGQEHGYLSGPDSLRAADINAMFGDAGVDGIICLRGGYGALRLLDMLDYDLIRANPKVFVGYSDITALHLAISRRTGLITFHGPMAASDMGGDIPDYTRDYFQRATGRCRPLGTITNPPAAAPPAFITPGEARGLLTGGNLSLIAATLGTPYEIDTTDKLLFIEEVGEQPYRVDRLLTQLLLAGKLRAAAGVIFAVCVDCDAEDDSPGFAVEEVLQDRLGGLTTPVMYNLYFGHTAEKATLPLGVMAELSAAGLTVTETAVI